MTPQDGVLTHQTAPLMHCWVSQSPSEAPPFCLTQVHPLGSALLTKPLSTAPMPCTLVSSTHWALVFMILYKILSLPDIWILYYIHVHDYCVSSHLAQVLEGSPGKSTLLSHRKAIVDASSSNTRVPPSFQVRKT